MHFSHTFIPTLREVPADAVIVSHRLMFRAGMVRKIANGIFTYLPLGLRSFRKIEQIIREEMTAINASEIKIPVVQPGELWKESGRWDAMGEGMLRAKNRVGGDVVVTPTAEEACTDLIRHEVSSYRQFPLMLYQTNTKYRDEVRPRYGVMRGREFTMHDCYSYDIDEAGLHKSYKAQEQAYRNIFKRCGLEVILVGADSGAIGGSFSEEFMVESNIGDNTLILCKNCDYAANVEKATCKKDYADVLAPAKLAIEKIDTPAVRTIDELCVFLKTDAKTFIKTLIYRAVNVELDLSGAPGANKPGRSGITPEAFFAVIIRGDLEVNEVKLAVLLKASEVSLAADTDVIRVTGAPVGFAGPVGLKTVPVIADETVTVLNDAVTGALAKDVHYIHVAYGRDFVPWKVADLRNAKAGDRCSDCGGELYEKKGNEVGHIFKLGSKYTKAMSMSFLDAEGQSKTPLMGTYGIGVDRTLASVIEEHHDEDGIIWPMSVAPYHVLIVPIVYGGAEKAVADTLEANLERAGIEVLLDDRDERPGVKFNDADLLGIPYRVVVGEKNLALEKPSVEVKRRGEQAVRIVEVVKAADELSTLVYAELAR